MVTNGKMLRMHEGKIGLLKEKKTVCECSPSNQMPLTDQTREIAPNITHIFEPPSDTSIIIKAGPFLGRKKKLTPNKLTLYRGWGQVTLTMNTPLRTRCLLLLIMMVVQVAGRVHRGQCLKT